MAKRTRYTSIAERARDEFSKHTITKIRRTFAWRGRNPSSSFHYFHIAWAPGLLVIGGDVGELVVSHYSFTDPWDAAAWVNGAGWDYFMEKSHAKKEYEPVATAEHIIERAYAHARDWRGTAREFDEFKPVVERYCWSHLADPAKVMDRKEACREMLSYAESGEFEPSTAYNLTEDFEVCINRFPERYHWQYEAFKFWARWMWENEPLWHKAVRLRRAIKAGLARIRDLRHTGYWHPIRYAEFEGATTYRKSKATSHVYHVFMNQGAHGAYFIPIVPLKLWGRTWDHLGFWQRSYNSQKDEVDTSPSRWWRPHTFRDIRPGDEYKETTQ